MLLSQVSKNPDNDGRLFVISYFLSNDMISIFENPTRNSGIISGKFLEKTRVPKPGSTANNPQFYSPADFVIGATVQSNFTFWSLSCFIADILENGHIFFYFVQTKDTTFCLSILVLLLYHAVLYLMQNSLSSVLFQFSVTAFCWLTQIFMYCHTWRPTQTIFPLRHSSLCAASWMLMEQMTEHGRKLGTKTSLSEVCKTPVTVNQQCFEEMPCVFFLTNVSDTSGVFPPLRHHRRLKSHSALS